MLNRQRYTDMTTETNHTLICQYLQGHQAELLRFIQSRTKDEDEAKDILQDVCLRLLTTDKMIGEQTIKSLFYTIANRLAIDSWRKRHCHQQCENNIAQTLNSLGNDPMNLYETNDIRRLIQHHLSGMHTLNRNIYQLQALEDQSIGDIARKLHITTKQVEYYLYNTRQEMRVWLKKTLTQRARRVCI